MNRCTLDFNWIFPEGNSKYKENNTEKIKHVDKKQQHQKKCTFLFFFLTPAWSCSRCPLAKSHIILIRRKGNFFISNWSLLFPGRFRGKKADKCSNSREGGPHQYQYLHCAAVIRFANYVLIIHPGHPKCPLAVGLLTSEKKKEIHTLISRSGDCLFMGLPADIKGPLIMHDCLQKTEKE